MGTFNTRLEENHQLRVNSSIPRTEAHCLLGSSAQELYRRQGFPLQQTHKMDISERKRGKGMEKRNHMADLKGKHACIVTETLETLFKCSSSLQKYYPRLDAKVGESMGYLPWKCWVFRLDLSWGLFTLCAQRFRHTQV